MLSELVFGRKDGSISVPRSPEKELDQSYTHSTTVVIQTAPDGHIVRTYIHTSTLTPAINEAVRGR